MKPAFRKLVLAPLAVLVAMASLPPAPASAVTDDEVVKAIEAGREHLIGMAKPDGSFGGDGGEAGPGGMSALVFMTLARTWPRAWTTF
jgi:hypothetical protein